MNRNEAEYCLSKQLPTMTAIETDYGTIEISDAMKDAIIAALTPILTKEKTK